MKKPNIIHHNPFGGSPSEWVSYADYELLRVQYEIALEDLRFAHRAATGLELLKDCRERIADALEALREVLDTRENEAKLRMRADVAVENYSNPQPEVDAAGMAMVAASEAERRARELLARIALAKGREG